MQDISTDTTGEVETISNRRARREDFKRIIAILAELFPMCFTMGKWEAHRPLKVGIHADLVASGLVTPRECTIALTAYTGRLQYQRAVAAGGARFDLDGNIAGEVAPDQIEHARAVVVHLESLSAARAEAARKLAVEPKRAAKQVKRKPKSPPPASSPTEPRRQLGLADLKAAAAARRNGGGRE
jgi:sRNA-binding protein